MKRIFARFPAIQALAAGALSPLAFAPFDAWFVAPVTLGWLFALLPGLSTRRRMVCGFAFGLGLFGVGVSWVYISLHTFGDMPVPLAVACVAGFVAVLSLYPAVAAWASGWFPVASMPLQLLVLFPALWVVVEFARNHLFTGFSWLQVGYSQVGTPLAPLGSLVGIHGVSLVTAWLAGLVACIMLGAGGRRLAWIFLVLVPYAVGFGASRIEWTEPAGEPVVAALVQGNVPLSIKWNSSGANEVARRYLEMSREVGDVDVIVWPESPLPYFVDQMGPRFYDEVVALPAPLLSGFLERRPTGDRGFSYHNSAVLFTDPVHVYRKRHLVPFGEYTPLPWLFEPLVAYFDVPMSVLTPFVEPQTPMPIAGRMAGVTICYEDAFPSDVRRFAADSHFLVNITEDAWFGDSLASHQRLQMARMRAIETARPMFRASNTGLATLIDHRGVVRAVSPRNTEFVLEGALQPRMGSTPYTRVGDGPVLSILAVMLIAGGFAARRTAAG